MAKAPDYRSSEGLSFELSGVFVLIYKVGGKKDDGSWSAQPVGLHVATSQSTSASV